MTEQEYAENVGKLVSDSMTEKQAITRFDGWIDSILDKANTANRHLKENEMLDVEMTELAIYALRKQIPTKVKKDRCPSCDLFFDDDDYDLNIEHIEYCMKCGQALDWSE